MDFSTIQKKLRTNQSLTEKESTDLWYYLIQSVAEINSLCAWEDEFANEILERDGEYSAFSEPHAVASCREFVEDHRLPRKLP